MGYKTIVINEECKISLEQNCVVMNVDNEKISIFISDINCMIFNHQKVVITIPIISRLIEENVVVIICDKRNDPIGSFLPFNSNSLPFKQLNKQIEWKITRKKKLWKLIIKEKINTEKKALEYCRKNFNNEKFSNYIMNVKSGDTTNREGAAAKLYFKYMFGHEYFRNEICPRNHALNYGYKILASYISKQIVARGYLTQLGINHCSGSNPFNLTYDFIETFRVIIDIWVYLNIDDEDYFSLADRMEIVNILNCKVIVEEKEYYLTNAIDMILDSYFNFLDEENESNCIKTYNLSSLKYES